MDSMRSLNSSLPSSRPAPPDLLQAFRTAALQVTNLYKSAVADHGNTRQEGYQDALEDLLKFLDSENLGVQDGEGWKIRQWATQRYDTKRYQAQSDSEDDTDPETRQSASAKAPETDVNSTSGGQVESITEPIPEQERSEIPGNQRSMFVFRGQPRTEQDMQPERQPSPISEDDAAASSSAHSARAEPVLQRSRDGIRPSNNRRATRSSQRDPTFSAGTKRKLNFPDFFDISNLHEKRDGTGSSGSKRGRLV